MSIRVRFAPSPTGYLHIGGARTALFNWLFAHNKKGTFILRIEDTDIARNKDEFTQAIINDLKWLGLDWDEGPGKEGKCGPYFQSQRLEKYKECIEKLKEKGFLYKCYCSAQELEERRKVALSKHHTPGYDGRCRNLDKEETDKYEKEGRPAVLRFKIPDTGETKFNDLVRGEVSFENKLIGDFIIQKSDGLPTFLFANTVDDILMDISHVIRGDDHLSNTPRQIMVCKALGGKEPVYAHVPLIFGKSGSPLSKRDGAVSLDWYREGGFLPDALMNYLALLGWAPDGVRQILSKEEMTNEFNIEKVSQNPAIFDLDKLTWVNSEHMQKLSLDQRAELVALYLKNKGLAQNPDRGWLKEIINIVGERLKLVNDIEMYGDFFFKDELKYDENELSAKLKDEKVKNSLKILKDKFSAMDFNHQNIESAIRSTAEESGLKAKDVIHPLRYVLTAKTVGPSLFEAIALIGREKVISRLSKVLI